MDGLSFDPSLSDASFSEWTQTTCGTPGEARCLFIGARREERGIIPHWTAVSFTGLHIGVIRGNWWHTTRVSVSPESCCTISVIEISFHYTDIGEAQTRRVILSLGSVKLIVKWRKSIHTP